MEGDYGEFIQPGPPREDAPGRYMAAFVPRFTPPVTRRVLSALTYGLAPEKMARSRWPAPRHLQCRLPDHDAGSGAHALGVAQGDVGSGAGARIGCAAAQGLGLASLSNAQMEFLASDCEEPLALIQALVAAARSEDQARTIAGEFDFAWSEAADLLFALQFTISAEQEAAGLEQLLQLADDAVERTLQAGIVRNRLPRHLPR